MHRAENRDLRFYVGQNRAGSWVVQDEQHRCGGIFLTLSDALKHIGLVRAARSIEAITIISGGLELDMSQ